MLRQLGWYHDLVETLEMHLRAEGAALRSRFGLRTVLIHLAIIAVFGVWWPHLRGMEFFDPVFLTAYTCLGVLFAGPAAAQSFQDRPESMRQAMARIFWSVFYGESVALIIVAGGIFTVLRTHPPIGPDWTGLIDAALLGLAGTVAMASLAAWFAIRFSPGAARMALRGLFIGLLLLFFFKSRWLPEVTGRGTSICAGIAILAMFAMQRAIRVGAGPPH